MKSYLFLFGVLFFCRTEISVAAQWKWTVSAEQVTEEMTMPQKEPTEKAVEVSETNTLPKKNTTKADEIKSSASISSVVVEETVPAVKVVASEPEIGGDASSPEPEKTFFSALLAGLSGQNVSAANQENMFEKIDADRNGFISENELFDNFQQTAEMSAEEKFLQLDSDGDDKISENEFLSQYLQKSEAVDDSVSESQEIYEGIIEESRKNFQNSDTDGDGFLSLSELQHFMLKTMLPQSSLIFHAVDSDEDGKISPDEFAAFFNMGEALKGSVSE